MADELFYELEAREALRLLAIAPEDMSPEQAMARAEVWRVVKGLPKELFSVAIYVGVMGYTQFEVAEDLQINQSSVSRRWQRALGEITRGLA